MDIDPFRFRIGLPKRLTSYFSLLAPKPDLIICLHAAPEIVKYRKQELSLIELKRQSKALKEFCQSNKRAVWIDTACDLEECVDKVLKVIFYKISADYDK